MGSTAKAQSAMEYLMTYGWALLIIALALAALYELGVFGGSSVTTPRAAPGTCQVSRPEGPGTVQLVEFEGLCNGEMPEFVAQFNGNNHKSSVIIPNSKSLDAYVSKDAITVSFWELENTSGIYATVDNIPVFKGQQDSIGNPTACSFAFRSNTFNVCGVGYAIYAPPVTSQWYSVIATYNGAHIDVYINGLLVSSTSATGSISASSSPLTFATSDPAILVRNYFHGSLSNIQIYDTALNSNDIKVLYIEGIGGAPINLASLVGWWPLNGDVNDYSGNGNNGNAINVSYSASWSGNYTPP